MAELADLLTGTTARHALALRDITAVFRILRDAGVSQLRIARATGQRQSEVSEAISGRRHVQSVELLKGIADGLGVPRGWMGLAYAPDFVPEPVVPDDATSEDEHGSNLLLHAATLLCGKPVLGVADPIRIQHTPTPVPRRIGSADIEQVAITTERLGQLVGDLGGIPMTAALTAHAQASEALLGADMREPVRPRLLLAVSDAHRAAGQAAEGAGLRDLARQHLSRAMDRAGAGGDLRRAVASDEPRQWTNFAAALPHVEGCTYLALGRFDRATVAFASAVDGTKHAVGCSVDNFGHLAAAQLRCGELRSGLHTAQQTLSLAKDLRSVSVLARLAPLQEAAAARRDSACRDLARELAALRSAA